MVLVAEVVGERGDCPSPVRLETAKIVPWVAGFG